MNKDILTVKDLNKYLPALKTEIDIHFQDKLKEGLFKVDALVGLKKIPSESKGLNLPPVRQKEPLIYGFLSEFHPPLLHLFYLLQHPQFQQCDQMVSVIHLVVFPRGFIL